MVTKTVDPKIAEKALMTPITIEVLLFPVQSEKCLTAF